jgi:hypothetical protein
MTRSQSKYVPYKVREDEMAHYEYEARCVWGPEIECGAESEPQPDADYVYQWKIKHTQETGHTRYRNSQAYYELWQPTEPVPDPKPVEPRQERS